MSESDDTAASDEREAAERPKQPKQPHHSETEVGTVASAKEIHGNVLEAAEEEMDRPTSELALAGLAAGLSISFSFLAVAFLRARMAPENHAIAAAIAYPLGFIFVVLASHQLFTENTLEPVIPVLERRDMASLRKLARLWAIVLPMNLVGTTLFALVVARTQTLDPALSGSLLDLAREGTSGSASVVFLRGIWAGWLIALMAWLLAATHETIAHIVIVWLTTAPIAAFGFKHSIAGSTEAFYRVWLGDVSLAGIMGSFEIPAIVGNIIGGVVLVAMINHGQGSQRGKKK
jgi:formate/nitrite transporter FocA (FNT family)